MEDVAYLVKDMPKLVQRYIKKFTQTVADRGGRSIFAFILTIYLRQKGKQYEKKKIKITGREVLPIQQGSRAFLETDQGPMLTSRVIKIKRISKSKLVFETENTIYYMSVEKQRRTMGCAV